MPAANANRVLSGQYALVTGGSRGIGAAIATRLAKDGAAIVLSFAKNEAAAKKVVAAIKKAGGEAEAVHADLARPEGPRNLMAGYDAAFGRRHKERIDILVNNAGSAESGSVHETDPAKYVEMYEAMFALNVRSPVALVAAASRRMVKAKSGRIINIGSGLGERVPFGGVSLYAATKFAVNGLTRGWSRELGPLGVTVNGVQPGPVDTEMNPADGAMGEMQKGFTSLGRYGRPEEIAAAVAFVASPAASFMNGENLTVDGGWNA